MKPAKLFGILSLSVLAPLGGCTMLVGEIHPTTESRYMTRGEQEYWADKQTRVDKSKEWSAELTRQSNERFDRYFHH